MAFTFKLSSSRVSDKYSMTRTLQPRAANINRLYCFCEAKEKKERKFYFFQVTIVHVELVYFFFKFLLRLVGDRKQRDENNGEYFSFLLSLSRVDFRVLCVQSNCYTSKCVKEKWINCVDYYFFSLYYYYYLRLNKISFIEKILAA